MKPPKVRFRLLGSKDMRLVKVEEEDIANGREALMKVKKLQADFCASVPRQSKRDYELEWLEMCAQNAQDIARLEIAERDGKRLPLRDLAAIYRRSIECFRWGYQHDPSPERRRWCGEWLDEIRREQAELKLRYGELATELLREEHD